MIGWRPFPGSIPHECRPPSTLPKSPQLPGERAPGEREKENKSEAVGGERRRERSIQKIKHKVGKRQLVFTQGV